MRKKVLVALLIAGALGVTACGKDNEKGAESNKATDKPISVESGTTDNKPTDKPTDDPEDIENDTITSEQALKAIKKYRYSNNPDLEEIEKSGENQVTWSVEANEDNNIVVLFKSYTGSETRYYINPSSGETYATELVPGIIDKEEKTEETLNIKDYLD